MRLLLRVTFFLAGLNLSVLTGWYLALPKDEQITHWILYVEEPSYDAREVYRMSINGKQRSNISQDPHDDIAPRASKHGIIFMSNRNQLGYELFRVTSTNPSAENVLRLPSDGTGNLLDVTSPHISSQGDWMVFTTDRASNYDIYRLDLATLEQTRLTSDAGAEYVSQITWDGQWILFDGSDGIYRMRSDGSASENLSTKLGFSAGSPAALSPNGEWLVYQSMYGNTPYIFRSRVDGSDTKPLVKIQAAEDIAPHFSRDGRWLFFLDNRALYRIQLDGTQRQEVVPAEFSPNSYYLLSPDNHWVFFTSVTEDVDVYRVRFNGSALTQITTSPVNEYLVDLMTQPAQSAHPAGLLMSGAVLMLISLGIRKWRRVR